jgi:hypothetical protein
MKQPAASTAELYQHVQDALIETMSAAGWVVDPTEPLGAGQSMVAAFQRSITSEVAVAAFFDRPFIWVAATRDPARFSLVAWLGVLYEPASRLWPVVFEEPPTPMLAVEAGRLDDPPHPDPVLVTGLGNVPAAVDALTGPVLRHGVGYGERYASIDQLVAGLRADQGWGPQFLPVVLAAAGHPDEARHALDALGSRGQAGEDRLDREAAGRLQHWLDEGAPLPDTITTPPVAKRSYFLCEHDEHSECPHVLFSTAMELLPSGVRMVHPEPPELDFSLCQCVCHADCSLADQAESVDWPDGCSCNATLKMRARAKKLPPSDEGVNVFATLGRGFEQARRKQSARRAAAGRSEGRSPEEVGTIIDEEWSRHGLDEPTGMTRKSEIFRITNPPSVLEQAANTTKFFRDLIGAPFRLRDRLRDVTSAPPDREDRTYEVATGDDRMEVQVDEQTRGRLGGVVDEGMLAPSLGRLFTVEIRDGQHDTIELWYRPSPDRSLEPLASLSSPDSDRFRRPLAAASRVGQRCTSKAFCIRDRDGQWSLGISLPLSPEEEEGAADQ